MRTAALWTLAALIGAFAVNAAWQRLRRPSAAPLPPQRLVQLTTLRNHLEDETTFEEFFADASLNPNASLITGVVCDVKVQEVEDPLMRRIRYLDKLVDELARGKPMNKVLRTG